MKRFMVLALAAISAANLHAGDIQKGTFRSKWDEEEAMEKERDRQRHLRAVLEMTPELAEGGRRLRRLLRERDERERLPATPSLESSPGRHIEYPIAREYEEKPHLYPYPSTARAWAKADLERRRAKKAEAYEQLEPNAPVPKISLEPIGMKNMPLAMEQTKLQQLADEKAMANLEKLYRAKKLEAYKQLEPNASVPRVDLTPIEKRPVEERRHYAFSEPVTKPGYLERFIGYPLERFRKWKRRRNFRDELAYKQLELDAQVPFASLTPIEDRSSYYDQYGPRYAFLQPAMQPVVQKPGYFERFSNWFFSK